VVRDAREAARPSFETLASLARSVLGISFVPYRFFPSSDRPELLVDLRLAQNASVALVRAAGTRHGEVRRNVLGFATKQS
jgi:multidrug efflux pump subunit AcrB